MERSLQRAELADEFAPIWEELKTSGALLLPIAQLDWAVKDPDAFLREATRKSRPLLLRACCARASSAAGTTVALEPAALDAMLPSDFSSEAMDFSSMLDDALATAAATTAPTVPLDAIAVGTNELDLSDPQAASLGLDPSA